MNRLALLLLIVLALLAPPSMAEAQRRKGKSKRTVVTRKGKQLRSKLHTVRRQKAQLRQELKKTRKQTRAVQESIWVVDARLERLEDELTRTTSRLRDSRNEQLTLAQQLARTNKRLAQVREQVRCRIREMYLRGEDSFISALAGSRSVTDIVSRQEIMDAISRRDREMFDEYRTLKAEVSRRKRRKDEIVADIRDLKGRQQRHQSHLASAKVEKREILQSLRQKQDRLKALIAQYERDESSIESEIAAFARRMAARPRRGNNGGPALPRFAGRFVKPCRGPITSPFGMRYHPILHYKRMHRGVDIGAGTGTPIYSAAEGEVIRAYYSNSYGNVIMIAHGGGVTTVYAHCSRIYVRDGQRVRQGQSIGAVGSTGLAKGPHLHFEVYVNGRAVNPLGRI